MKLGEYAKSGKYLKWIDTDQYDIICDLETYDDFFNLEPVFSEVYEAEQYEIPVMYLDNKEMVASVLATRSKDLMRQLLEIWEIDMRKIVRVKKRGHGFATKWIVQDSNKAWHGGKIVPYKPSLK